LEFVMACLEWSTGRPLAAGAAENEIANALLAIAQMAGLGRVVAAAPDVATALDTTSRSRWRSQTVTDARQLVTSTCRRTGA
jgi:hypothetical protein